VDTSKPREMNFFHHRKLGLCLNLILHFHLCTGAKKCVLRTPNESGHSTCQNVWIYESTFYTFKWRNVMYYKYYFTWFVDFLTAAVAFFIQGRGETSLVSLIVCSCVYWGSML
jgi:hypothetical protein